MSRRSTPCTQADITRLIKGAMAAGLGAERITGIKMTRDGAVILFGERSPAQTAPDNEWDEVLDQ